MFKSLTNIYLPSIATINTIVHIGAGKCSEQIAYRKLSPDKIILVEAESKKANRLKRLDFSHCDVSIVNTLIVPDLSYLDDDSKATFFQANNFKYNSLYNFTESLKASLPNVEVVPKLLHAKPINEFLLELNASPSTNNILNIDILDPKSQLAESISEEALARFSLVGVLISKIQDNETDLIELINIFANKGYEFCYLSNEQGSFDYVYFKNSPIKASQLNIIENDCIVKQEQISRLELKLIANLELEEKNNKIIDELSVKLADFESKIKVQKETIGILEEKLALQLDENAKEASIINELKRELESKNIELADLSRKKDLQLFDREAKIESLEQKFEKVDLIANKAMKANEMLSESILTKIDENTQKQEEALKKLLNQGFNNSIKQIESFIGIQTFLTDGSIGMNFHGWPISSDIALYLLGRIKENNYDLIIEFGSGTSTQLFAKAMVSEASSSLPSIESVSATLIEDHTENRNHSVVNYSRELPKRVLSFEHNKEYFDKTRQTLTQNGLSEVVNLVHAPLVDCQVDGEHYLYYNCDLELAHIANVFNGRVAKILVLVDGPPAKTGPLARMPAMSKLLNNLGCHQLDIILDDYIRSEEKQIASAWKKMLEARFIDFEEEVIPCEKGALVCRINSK